MKIQIHSSDSQFKDSHSVLHSLWINYWLQTQLNNELNQTKPKQQLILVELNMRLYSPQPLVTAHWISLSSDQSHDILWWILLAVLKVACIHLCSVQCRKHAMLLRVALINIDHSQTGRICCLGLSRSCLWNGYGLCNLRIKASNGTDSCISHMIIFRWKK